MPRWSAWIVFENRPRWPKCNPMAEILNLNQARKAKTREKARKTADENAVKFGRTKAQKQREAAQAKKAQTLLDGHKREE